MTEKKNYCNSDGVCTSIVDDQVCKFYKPWIWDDSVCGDWCIINEKDECTNPAARKEAGVKEK